MRSLLRIARAITDNDLYCACVRKRGQLAMRQFDDRSYDWQHRAQQRFYEWWLDRFDMVQWHIGTLDRYLWRQRKDLEIWFGLARWLTAATQMHGAPKRCPAPMRGLDQTHEWLQRNAGSYHGLWVAVRHGVLIGTATTFGELLRSCSVDSDTLCRKIPDKVS